MRIGKGRIGMTCTARMLGLRGFAIGLAGIVVSLSWAVAYASEVHPEVDRYYRVAKEMVSKRNYEGADEVLSIAISRYPNSIKLYDARGLIRGDYLKRPVDAIRDYATIIKLGGNHRAYFKRGHYLHVMAQYELAVLDFTKAVEMSPKYGKAYMARAESYEKLGRRAEAIADLKSCVRYNPEYLPAAQRMLERLAGGETLEDVPRR